MRGLGLGLGLGFVGAEGSEAGVAALINPVQTFSASGGIVMPGTAAWSNAVQTLAAAGDVLPGGMALWLNSEQGVTITGQGVSRWADQSGNGNDAVQGTDGQRPTYNTGGANGRPYLASIDTARNMTGAFASTFTQATYFVVTSLTAADNGGHTGAPLATFTTVAMTVNTGCMLLLTTGTNIRSRQELGGTTDAIYNYTGDTVPHIWSWIEATGANTLYQDGTQRATVAGPTAIATNAYYRIFQYAGGGSGPWNGALYEIIVYPSALSAANEDLVVQYLGRKYAITVT